MTRKTWIRAASAVTLLYAIGHSAGYPWTPVVGPREAAVIQGMKSLTVKVGGASRSYWDFYEGFGIALGALLLFQAIVLWQLAAVAGSEWGRVRAILLSFGAAFVVNAVIVAKYFFALPLILALSIVACLAAAALSR